MDDRYEERRVRMLEERHAEELMGEVRARHWIATATFFAGLAIGWILGVWVGLWLL